MASGCCAAMRAGCNYHGMDCKSYHGDYPATVTKPPRTPLSEYEMEEIDDYLRMKDLRIVHATTHMLLGAVPKKPDPIRERLGKYYVENPESYHSEDWD